MSLNAYRDLGVDVDAAIQTALGVPIGIHCWQADDVTGLEFKSSPINGGGLVATGNYPGKARNGDEMREDFDTVRRWIPGVHRLNLHAMYAETSAPIERNEVSIEHFSRWIDWSKSRMLALDFNPTYFAHRLASSGSLSHVDPIVRDYWIDHGRACRSIASDFARIQGSDCLLNHWVPDGDKDSPVDRWSPRERLRESLDRVLEGTFDGCIDTVESKLFGIGLEDYTVGSFEFYSSYALRRGVGFCLDMGHFHPTETIPDKLSGLLTFHDRLLIHVSRPIRWDSDHVVLFNDDLRAVFVELVRGDALPRVWIALDFFDASLPRTMAYGIGVRATRMALLQALLEPTAWLKQLEAEGRRGEKLAWLEEAKLLPFSLAWAELLRQADCPGAAWIEEARTYDEKVRSTRG